MVCERQLALGSELFMVCERQLALGSGELLMVCERPGSEKILYVCA